MRSIALAALLLGFSTHAAASRIVYSNLAEPAGFGAATQTLWDDAQIEGGGLLTRFRFLGVNMQSGPPRVWSPLVSIHLYNTITDAPDGEVLGRFPVMSEPIPAGSARMIDSGDLTERGIVLPPNARLGVRITLGGNFGPGFFLSPTIGSSDPTYWTGSTNPMRVPERPGAPPANIGFEIVTIPEPLSGSLAILGVLAGGARRTRRGAA